MNELAHITPYEGNEDYIFISYSHQDTQTILPILYRLREEGFRFWYDEGIDPGTEWPESIADHLLRCRVCIAFISPAAMVSHHCRREIYFAMSEHKEFLSVTLAPTELTPGMKMQLSPYQSLVKHKYTDEEQFFQRLLSLDMLASCQAPVPEQAPAPIAEAPEQPAQQPASGGGHQGLAKLGGLAAWLAGAAAAWALASSNSDENEQPDGQDSADAPPEEDAGKPAEKK